MKGKPRKNYIPQKNSHNNGKAIKAVTSLLDLMEDGKEYESMIKHPIVNVDFTFELRRAIGEMEKVRGKRMICYVANVVNTQIKANTGIDNTDDLPFSEMIAQIPPEEKEIDVLIVTGGGSGQQVARFVDRLRNRFDKVSFILPNMAMSAGTIFALSGDEIIMNSGAHIGPIDPQVIGKNGRFVAAQSLLTLITEIQKRGDELLKAGKNPLWTDLQILNQIDAKEIGSAINGSKYSIDLVKSYLNDYKFKSWNVHSSNGQPVTSKEKEDRSKEIAELLCDHSIWKTHATGIPREVAWDICKLKILHSEDIKDFDRLLRRYWALLYWVFGNTAVFKMFLSQEYCILRNDKSALNN
ncbi:hypothetical protein [Maribacter sp. 1_MG-2023]|uniref:SDH family Clp fold serine proteinase n=1 Tax=Maribacter sp. 1_MG-2023 TaxID=3062677 RepID=UPI0026E3AA43|nr:hypothetical protein [Maribacter sp. 1_MG-2023]MDO6473610.1 hypothetical protein [Maribacter sp. 1_MG-2023]